MAPHAELVGPIPKGTEPEAYDQLRRKVLWKLTNGLYLLGSRAGERANLMAVSLVTQVATSPKLIAAAVERDALTAELVRDGGGFSLSLLARGDRSVVRSFAKPAAHDLAAKTLNGLSYHDAPVSGSPVPSIAVGVLDCRLEREVALGSHTLMVGEVVDASFPHGEDQAGELLRMEDTRMSYGG